MNIKENRSDTFANRLNLAMKKNNLTQSVLSEKTKQYKYISQSLINKYLKQKAFARQDNIYVLSKVLNVNEAWLMGYDVNIERIPDEQRRKAISIWEQDNYINILKSKGLDNEDIKKVDEYIKLLLSAKRNNK